MHNHLLELGQRCSPGNTYRSVSEDTVIDKLMFKKRVHHWGTSVFIHTNCSSAVWAWSVQAVAVYLYSLFVLSSGWALCGAYRHVYLCSSQTRASSSMFQAEGQWVRWILELPAVVLSPEGTVHLVNMDGSAASTGLADTWLLARQPVGCPQARKTAGQGKSVCSIQSRHDFSTKVSAPATEHFLPFLTALKSLPLFSSK